MRVNYWEKRRENSDGKKEIDKEENLYRDIPYERGKKQVGL